MHPRKEAPLTHGHVHVDTHPLIPDIICIYIYISSCTSREIPTWWLICVSSVVLPVVLVYQKYLVSPGLPPTSWNDSKPGFVLGQSATSPGLPLQPREHTPCRCFWRSFWVSQHHEGESPPNLVLIYQQLAVTAWVLEQIPCIMDLPFSQICRKNSSPQPESLTTDTDCYVWASYLLLSSFLTPLESASAGLRRWAWPSNFSMVTVAVWYSQADLARIATTGKRASI